MMDANARFAICKKLEELQITPTEFLENRAKFLKFYEEGVTNTYIQNARWSIEFGKELFKNSEEPMDYVVFVYNHENKQRGYWKHIKKAVETVGPEVIKGLSDYANLYAFGTDKKHWQKEFPELKNLTKPEKDENRAIFGFCFQQKTAYDKSVEHIRDIDYFIRASQLRLSGMYFPALDNALFVLLTHPPALNNASKLAKKLIEIKENDLEHDQFNIYKDPNVYKEWSEHIKEPPLAIISSIAHAPTTIKTTR